MSSEFTAEATTADGELRPDSIRRWATWRPITQSAFRVTTELIGSLRERLGDSIGFSGDRPRDRAAMTEPRGLVLRPALLGFAAILAVSIGASLPSSPFKLEMPGVWFFGVPSSQAGSQWGLYFTLAAVYGGLFLFMRVWWGMTRLYSRCQGVPFNRMMWVFALWSLPMLVIAPLFSRDVYSYAAQGEMVSHHMNPYLYGPFQLGNNSYTNPVDPLWGNAPRPTARSSSSSTASSQRSPSTTSWRRSCCCACSPSRGW